MNANTSTGHSNLAHTLAAYLGVLIGAQAPIAAYLATLPIPVKVANLAIGALALFGTFWKMYRDSVSHENITVAQINATVAQAAAAPAPAPAAPPAAGLTPAPAGAA